MSGSALTEVFTVTILQLKEGGMLSVVVQLPTSDGLSSAHSRAVEL